MTELDRSREMHGFPSLEEFKKWAAERREIWERANSAKSRLTYQLPTLDCETVKEKDE
jgi:hypothetical protein